MKHFKVYTAALFLLLCTHAVAKPPDLTLTSDEQALLEDMVATTKVNLLSASQIDGVAINYKSDGDPTTLEIVMLRKGEGIDHVSEDGEIIFIHEKTKAKAQQEFMATAFYLRTKKQYAEKNKLIGSSSSSSSSL
ncbi:MAG: hypothetical protein V4732_04240 [Pseudomonadota bacterium]